MATVPKYSLACLIECPVCMEDMGQHNKPKVLPCQHTVCEKCITGIDQRCPLCRLSFPQNSSENLPTNLTNLQLGDIIRERDLESKKKLCEYCPDKPKVITHYCKDCTDYFCSACVNQHRDVFDDHLPVPITRNSCKKHGKPYTMFCMDCDTLLCTVCVQHKVCCKNRNKKKIQYIKVQKTQNLKKLTKQISAEIQYNKEYVIPRKTVLKCTLENIKEMKLNVRTHTQKLQDRLKQREYKLLDEINKYESKILQMQNSLDLGIDSETLSQLKETADAALAGDIEQILLTLPSIQSCLTQTAPQKYSQAIPENITFKPEDSLQVGNLHNHDEKGEVIISGDCNQEHTFKINTVSGCAQNGGDCEQKHTCIIKTVSVTAQNGHIGSNLWDIVIMKESVMAITDYRKKVVLLVNKWMNVLTDSRKQRVVFQAPRGIDYHDTQGCLVVCDGGARCVSLLDPTKLSLKKNVYFKQFSPCGVAVMSNGNIVLTDDTKKKLGVFEMNGTQLYSWDTYYNGTQSFSWFARYIYNGASPSRFIQPQYVTVDRDNNIYVADSIAEKIVKFSEAGEILCEWKTEDCPFGLTLCGDKILVAEWGSPNCVREYSVERIPGRPLIIWNAKAGFGCIMSVAIHQSQLAVTGQYGLRTYTLTYK